MLQTTHLFCLFWLPSIMLFAPMSRVSHSNPPLPAGQLNTSVQVNNMATLHHIYIVTHIYITFILLFTSFLILFLLLWAGQLAQTLLVCHNSTSSPIGWRMLFGHFLVAFLYSLRISQRLSNSLWAFPSGFPTPFEHFQAAVQQPLRAFLSSCWLKCGNFQLFLKDCIAVKIFKKAKKHLTILESTSGSSSSTDLSNNITFSQSQSHATVPLRVLLSVVNILQKI